MQRRVGLSDTVAPILASISKRSNGCPLRENQLSAASLMTASDRKLSYFSLKIQSRDEKASGRRLSDMVLIWGSWVGTEHSMAAPVH